ncbi:hypothetical protein [Mesorhizobium sp.]|uniref:hypothetical protein n=1 Tax=Mesorhizobium sp. TaxID=1871066 RepID=UPI0025BE4594|nr:hypothetical protein [Mesorhizobium sp.]
MDNLPANIELHSAATQRSIETVLADQDGVYDVILMDSPVVDSSTRGIPIGPDQRDQLAGLLFGNVCLPDQTIGQNLHRPLCRT